MAEPGRVAAPASDAQRAIADPRFRGAVLVAVGLSAAAHLAVVTGLWPHSVYARGQSVSPSMSVRLLSAAATPSPDGGDPGTDATTAPVASARVAPLAAEPSSDRDVRPARRSGTAPADPGRVEPAPASRPAPGRSETYLSAGASRMDPGPQPLGDIEPAFPPEAGLREGLVVLTLFINEHGSVDEVKVVRATPPGLFEQSAIAAFSAAQFSPGKVLGSPVKSQITIEVAFTPFNRGATVSGRSY